MPVFRIEKTRNYTVMSNHHLQNANLSLKAKGLLSLMLSLPDDWDYTMKGLTNICKDGVGHTPTGITSTDWTNWKAEISYGTALSAGMK